LMAWMVSWKNMGLSWADPKQVVYQKHSCRMKTSNEWKKANNFQGWLF
jgi:hypothetical protein